MIYDQRESVPVGAEATTSPSTHELDQPSFCVKKYAKTRKPSVEKVVPDIVLLLLFVLR